MYPHHRVSSGLFTGVLLLTLLAAVIGPANSQPTPEKTVVNSIGMKFVFIPAGTFQMGSTTGDKDEQPVHQVTISKPFYMGETEVTQAQWKAIMGTNPSLFQGGPNRPVPGCREQASPSQTLTARQSPKLPQAFNLSL